MKRVELVFRTVGERTTELALELAKAHIRPDRVHVIQNVEPFWRAVQEQLRIDHDCDVVVYVDADCLILEDMRPFLEWNDRPYVDCYVHDRFRGRIHCGVHITRIDIVRGMRDVCPPTGELPYVLRPESALRNRVMKARRYKKAFKGFHILHDHFQAPEHIWAKYALRELRSRTPKQRARLEAAMAHWDESEDYRIARQGIAHAAEHVPTGSRPRAVAGYIERLPELSREAAKAFPARPPLRAEELPPPAPAERPKVFGLGLSRTGTRSLTAALHVLGWDTLHYPTDAQTLEDLMRGDGRFDVLEHFDGLTDITVAPCYRQLDERYPGSKFILTVRDEASWLHSCAAHWADRPAFDDPKKGERHMRVRRLLRAATYGCYSFDAARFADVYRHYVDAVRRHFGGRGDFLELPLTTGVGWAPLCGFLGVPEPREPFPHKGGTLSRSMDGPMRGLEVRD